MLESPRNRATIDNHPNKYSTTPSPVNTHSDSSRSSEYFKEAQQE